MTEIRRTALARALSVLFEVRRLHEPVHEGYSLYCNGCDGEGFEREAPSWPCRTAKLVYSLDEIADYLEAANLFRKWDMQRRRTLPPGKPSLVQLAYGPMLKRMLEPMPLLHFENTGPVTGRFSTQHPPETQQPHPLMMRDVFRPGETVTFTRTERLDTD